MICHIFLQLGVVKIFLFLNPYISEFSYAQNPENVGSPSSNSYKNVTPYLSIQSWKCGPIQQHIPISLLLGSTPHRGIPNAPIPISAAIQSPTIVPFYRDKVDPNSRNPSEPPRTLSIVKINKGCTAPNIGPKRMDLNARCLEKPDAVPALYTELSNNNIDTIFPRIIAGGDDYFFATKRSRLFEGAINPKKFAHWRSWPKYLVYYSIKPKIDNIK